MSKIEEFLSAAQKRQLAFDRHNDYINGELAGDPDELEARLEEAWNDLADTAVDVIPELRTLLAERKALREQERQIKEYMEQLNAIPAASAEYKMVYRRLQSILNLEAKGERG